MEHRLERRTQVMAAQAQAMSRLGRSTMVHDPTRDEGLELLTATLAQTLDARRASFWRLAAVGKELRCEDLFDAVAETHVRGMQLPHGEHVRFIEALARGDVFEVANARADPRTQELAATLLAETGTRSLLCIPAMRGPALVGALLLEDREMRVIPMAEASAFGLAIASIAVARMTAAETARRTVETLAETAARRAAGGGTVASALPPPPSVTRLGDGAIGREPGDTVVAPAAARSLGEPGLAAELFPAVTVLVLHLVDSVALTRPTAEVGSGTLTDMVVQLAQDCAARHGIAYLRVMGSAVMLADGFGGRAEAAPASLALLALDLAEHCAGLFASLDLLPGFAIGIDIGPAIGAAVGSGRRTYNIWGDAVRGAEAMVDTAPRGAVQVSEALQSRIAEGFIFRPRGRFWLPGSGETSTFLLTGRA